ncbi:TIGR03759 family integrating conjugative element protein [Dickeya fangzhongdai]|uniref:TIGR03759 family integrating conjugative element protein n=1 Tax=Dickeya fangzhongdai TaxID=1778540 RepID=UPI002B257985|nr:TIGR03759 family integrating conjugative element protein [Dickeya fangzhongdai]WOY03094.1 TIGR03759 family integrating conjugative element protein [Dickeya fangzhongdai]
MRMKFVAMLVLASASSLVNASVNTSVRVENSRTQTLDQGLSRLQSSQWGLTDDEWSRYQDMMRGKTGIQSPGLDPLTALGIDARSDEERRQLAEKWVREEYQRTEKILKFQREVTAAWDRLYPNVLPVNMGNGNAGGVAHDNGGRLALFVKASGCGNCNSRLAAVLADNRPVDIYLVDSDGDDNKLRQWARERSIPVERVRSRQVTLNHDGGRWMRFGNGLMPVLLQQGDDGWRIVAF